MNTKLMCILDESGYKAQLKKLGEPSPLARSTLIKMSTIRSEIKSRLLS